MESLSKKIKLGESFEVALENRGTSGLTLDYSLTAPNIVKVEKKNQVYEYSKVGNPLLVTYLITGIGKGKTQINFFETQTWDKDFIPISKQVIQLTVE